MDTSSRKTFRKRGKLLKLTGIAGEALLSAGALMGLFLSWHLVFNDSIQGDRQNQSAMSLAKEWSANSSIEPIIEPENSISSHSDDEPPITASPPEGQAFALLYVPRFGDDYVRSIAEGVDIETVLNSRTLGIGRYLESNQLGEMGNFAIAAHRTTWGAAFGDIAELRIGDRIYVEVLEGWHVYQFRNLEYVWETEVDVLNAFPRMNLDQTDAKVITLTSCHPRFSEAERIIAYGVYEGWYPRKGGSPAEITELVKGSS
jgi:sortase A